VGILDPRRGKKPDRDLKQIGLFTAAPFMLLVGPLLGWLGGQWLDKQWSTEPYLAALGGALGLVSAAMQIYKLIKQSQAIGKEDDDEGSSQP